MSQYTFNEDKNKELAKEITSISVRGYKSLYDECNIEIRPLTILAGANSSGKSSIMQPLLMMKQTLEATYNPGDLMINGPNVKLTLADQMFSKIPDMEICQELEIEIKIDNKLTASSTFSKHSQGGIELVQNRYDDNKGIVVLKKEMSRDDIIELLRNRKKEAATIEREEVLKNMRWNFFSERCFLDLYSTSTINLKNDNNILFLLPLITLYDSHSHTSLFKEKIRKLIHVPGLRGNPERNYKLTGINDKNEFIGTFENYVATVINHWQKTGDKRLNDLSNSLETLGLTNKVEARKIDDTQVEIQIGRLPKNFNYQDGNQASDMVSIADVGFGVSQVLPVLVALVVAEPGQLVYLEQPEIHLHPRAQIALAEILTDAANRDVKVVLETHSDKLLLAIQSLVAEEKISPDKVKLHWFTRQENGMTKINSADLDEAGAFGDWSEDFGDVSLELESRYLNAAEAHLFKQSHGS
ncbi:MAG: AAA family ATPase [Nostocaceae cyanobacterium]|nr:AAA family ATPase [Nostocaceae cyanobacterium]